MVLDQYQVEGARFLAAAPRAAGLADEPGMGKTAQAICAARNLGARRVRVVCRAIGITHWTRQWVRWSDELNCDVRKLEEVVSYDRLSQDQALRKEWARRPCHVLILDEAHYLKSASARRTKVLYGSGCKGTGLVGTAERVFLLTGTPAPNDNTEYWTHFRALRPELIWSKAQGAPMSFEEYRDRFTRWTLGPYGPRIWGNKHVEGVRAVIDAMWLRRPASLLNLKPMRWDHVPLDTAIADELKGRIFEGADLDERDVAMASWRREVGLAKAPAVADIIGDELKHGAYNKIVLFAHHIDVVRSLAQLLGAYNPVYIHGGVSRSKTDAALETFAKSEGCHVMIGQMDACGTSVDMTAADEVAFAESSWVPGTMYQAMKRVHRRGQERHVRARVFGLAGTLDDAISATLTRKEAMAAELRGEAVA